MATSQNRAQSRGGVKINGSVIGSVFLGICILVGSFKIGGSIKALSTSVDKQTFASTYSSPSDIKVDMAGTDKKYLTLEEAAEYLNISTDKVEALISAGKIKEYVKTDSGYSISIKDLNDWFENEIYEREMQSNAEKLQQ